MAKSKILNLKINQKALFYAVLLLGAIGWLLTLKVTGDNLAGPLKVDSSVIRGVGYKIWTGSVTAVFIILALAAMGTGFFWLIIAHAIAVGYELYKKFKP